MSGTIARQGIFFLSFMFFLIIITIQFVRRRWKFKKYFGGSLLYTISATYVYNAFGDIKLDGAEPFDQFLYSKIPFGNFIYNHVQFEDATTMSQFRHDFFSFFALTISFLILFAFIVTFFFNVKDLKRFWIISFVFFEVVQFILMQLSYRFLIAKTYPLVFDTGAFILVPICLFIGIFVGNKLRKVSHDKN